MSHFARLFYVVFAIAILAVSQLVYSQTKPAAIITEVDFRFEGGSRDWEQVDRLYIFDEATNMFYDETFAAHYPFTAAEFQEKVVPFIIAFRVGMIVLPALAEGISEYIDSHSMQRAGVATVVGALAGGYGALATARAATRAARVFFLGASVTLISSTSTAVNNSGSGSSDGGGRNETTDATRDSNGELIRARERTGAIDIGNVTLVCEGRDCMRR